MRNLILLFALLLLSAPVIAQEAPSAPSTSSQSSTPTEETKVTDPPVYLPALLFTEMTGMELHNWQEERLERISRESVDKINAMLNDEQKAQFQAGLKSGKELKEAMGNILLTEEQVYRLRDIVTSARSQVASMLSRGQKLELAGKMRMRRRP
ncbi:MAG: hypothetical protein H7Y37_14215 [Anaerolineae bacterium]|nr:hypothetical protein [Gloeobacterales cyanobacterium ES-bin-313]